MTKKNNDMAVSAGTAKLLRAVKAAILAEPRRINMREWLHTGEDAKTWARAEGAKLPQCNTVGCIAGWAVALSKDGKKILKAIELAMEVGLLYEISEGFYEDQAANLLNISPEEASRLFLPGNWPTDFMDRLEQQRPGTKAYALVVADRIDHFIKTGE